MAFWQIIISVSQVKTLIESAYSQCANVSVSKPESDYSYKEHGVFNLCTLNMYCKVFYMVFHTVVNRYLNASKVSVGCITGKITVPWLFSAP